jgi:endonuclease/exonuclease/phosphatase family metal-dependent hydrolase
LNTLRLMTYNMLHAPGDRLGALVDVVRAEDPDIVACQEINSLEGGLDLARELGMVPVWGRANGAEDCREGAPVFEHLLVLAKVWPELVRVHEGDRRAMFRPVLETLFRFPGLPAVRLFVVHLRALVDAEVRFLRFRELGALLGVLAEAEGGVVVMGDFNAREPGAGLSGPVREVPEDHRAAVNGEVVRAIKATGLMDSLRLLHPHRTEGESTLIKVEGSRVDYIFVNGLLVPHVSRSYIVDNDAVVAASDHRPVVAELSWDEGSASSM